MTQEQSLVRKSRPPLPGMKPHMTGYELCRHIRYSKSCTMLMLIQVALEHTLPLRLMGCSTGIKAARIQTMSNYRIGRQMKGTELPSFDLNCVLLANTATIRGKSSRQKGCTSLHLKWC